ncbi:MAG: 4Fe-4S binding protein, partial [Chloroflexota bacterium]
VDVPDVVDYCGTLEDVAFSGGIGYACTQEAAEQIKDTTTKHGLTHVVLAACSCCGLDQICFSCSDRRVLCKSNLLSENELGVTYEFINIREHCAWVHRDRPEEASAKAKTLIRAGVARVRLNRLSAGGMLAVERSALVVGDGLGGMQAASHLSAMGFETDLIVNGDTTACSSGQYSLLKGQMESELRSNRARVLHGAKLVNVEGSAGRYQVTAMQDGKPLRLAVGAIILDRTTPRDLPPLLSKAVANGRQAVLGAAFEPAVSRLPGVFLCGAEGAADVADAVVRGAAAASKAAVWLTKGLLETKSTIVAIDQSRCRGCGTCASVCQVGAIALVESASGVFTAQVDEGVCQGCGMCAAYCPSGALSQYGHSDEMIAASLQAILS